MFSLIVIACALPAGPVVPDSDWDGIPLQKGTRPPWANSDIALVEWVSTKGDGHRFAARVFHPTVQPAGPGKATIEHTDNKFTVRGVVDGGTRSWTIGVGGKPERVAGSTTLLHPTEGRLVGGMSGAAAIGVLDLGDQAFGVRCEGPGADWSLDGWCIEFFSRVWVETWEG